MVNSMEDVVAKQKDFVVHSEDMAAFQKKYQLDSRVLGYGAFAMVKKATLENGEQRAIKIIDKLNFTEEERVGTMQEIDILKNLIHPNIMRLYEVYESKSQIILVTELCDGHELFDEICSRRSFNEKDAALVTKQILQAIAYCHE